VSPSSFTKKVPLAQSRTDERCAVADNDEPEIAVALRYDKDKDNAPRILAKGVRTRAERILEIAKQSGVPIMRNIPLAHALSRLEIGDEVPEQLYDAVAEVLNYVYELSKDQ
jgi:flagellar biosynthesis protein